MVPKRTIFEHYSHLIKLKGNLRCVLDEAGRDGAEFSKRVACAIRSLVNARGLQLECARTLHETLFVHVLTYGSEIILWKEKERSRIRVVQLDNLRSLLGISWKGRVLSARIRELCRVTKGVDERIDEAVF